MKDRERNLEGFVVKYLFVLASSRRNPSL